MKRSTVIKAVISIVLGILLTYNSAVFGIFIYTASIFTGIIFTILYLFERAIQNEKSNGLEIVGILFLVLFLIGVLTFDSACLGLAHGGPTSRASPSMRTNIITGQCSFGGGGQLCVEPLGGLMSDVDTWYYKEGCNLEQKEMMEICKESSISKRACAAEVADIEACNNLEEGEFKKTCYRSLIPEVSSIKTCKKIKRHIDNEGSIERCYRNVIEQSVNPSFCQNIEIRRYKEECYSHIAKTEEDPSYCKQITNIEIRDSCYAGVMVSKGGTDYEDWKICAKISNQSIRKRDDCYYELFLTLRNPKLCEKIETKEVREDCRLEADK